MRPRIRVLSRLVSFWNTLFHASRLGADGRQVMREVLRESLTFALSGCAAGLGAALIVSRLLQSQLCAIHPRDPIAYSVAVSLILAGAALACWIPVRRAMAVSPMAALLFE